MSNAERRELGPDRVQRPTRPRGGGYLLIAMTHPTLGRPRVKALPYGSSIPEIDVEDVQGLSIPRLDAKVEADIADLVEEAARLRDRADELETRLAASADAELERFTNGG